MASLKLRVHTLLEPGEAGDWASKSVDACLIALILANGLVAILITVPAVAAYRGIFYWFEVLSVAIFTVEYLLRIWSCTAVGASPVLGRLRHMLRPMLLIDFVAILPFYLAFLGVDLRMVRILRVVRFLRIAKMGRYSRSLQSLGSAVRSCKEDLTIAVLLGVLALVISATLMYYAEHSAQPEVFTSIPAAFWWAVTTLTTVGYGDAYPVTILGKIFGGLAQVVGVGLFALPMGIVAAAFQDQMKHRRETAAQSCPHCGKEIIH